MIYQFKFLKSFSIVFLFLILSSSCNNNPPKSVTAKEIDKWNHRKILLPTDSISMVNLSKKDSANYFNYPVKIVTFIDGTCSECISTLTKWKGFISKLKNQGFNVRFYPYIYANSFAYFDEWNEKYIHFSEPMIYDYGNAYKIKNELPEDKMFQTFLLNYKNQVLIIGNPINHKELNNLYVKQISLLSKKVKTKI